MKELKGNVRVLADLKEEDVKILYRDEKRNKELKGYVKEFYKELSDASYSDFMEGILFYGTKDLIECFEYIKTDEGVYEVTVKEGKEEEIVEFAKENWDVVTDIIGFMLMGCLDEDLIDFIRLGLQDELNRITRDVETITEEELLEFLLATKDTITDVYIDDEGVCRVENGSSTESN